ncbi:hypothetical protein [Bifidobacterium oedipodis]|nr:hypothetical protein [Bifidobacterium sp. DSM 109957]
MSVDETMKALGPCGITEREVIDIIRHTTPRQMKAAMASPDFIEPQLDID